MKNNLSYVSLFSGGGLGCFGLQSAGFECVATAELLPRRMEVQKANNFTKEPNGYILGDITKSESRTRLLEVVDLWKKNNSSSDITLLMATPPCQGMSVANHKKKNELSRNSLVIESLALIKEINPKFFLLENVRSFLKTECTDLDGRNKTIGEAIALNLGGLYSIDSRIINFKEYGANSSRTRTLVIGVRRDVTDVSPSLLFPDLSQPLSLKELIGDLPALNEMGEISPNDIYHAFKPYDPRMRPWISNLQPGQSAFDNKSEALRPNRIVDGVRVANREANGDKYKRNTWEKVAPCVHTRNDILASQSTIHPTDDRVFSIRELCRMMGVPANFKWSPFDLGELNALPLADKRQYLAQHEMNIRQCLGEGVPTQITQAIGSQIAAYIKGEGLSRTIAKHLSDFEKNNIDRDKNSAFLTRVDIASVLVNSLPELKTKKILRILEPSVGAGSFLPLLLEKYKDRQVEIDVIDIDPLSIEAAKRLAQMYKGPNLSIRYITEDYLEFVPDKKYDIVVGNPPFGKDQVKSLRNWSSEYECKDLFAKFLEHSLNHAHHVSFIVPKTILSGPEHQTLRNYLSTLTITGLHDFGEKAFENIKIETVGLSISTSKSIANRFESISYPLKLYSLLDQDYVCDKSFPTWLIYRNKFFDQVASQLDLGTFIVVRDRELSSKHLAGRGIHQVLRAANIPRNGHSPAPISFLKSDTLPHAAKEYLNSPRALVAPNLSYYPRAAKLKKGQLVDGSAAVLIPKTKQISKQIDFFGSDVFFYFYRIARNFSTRSLNIDRLSVHYWGLPKSGSLMKYDPNFVAMSGMKFIRPKDLHELERLRS